MERHIVHCDLDTFFVSVERLLNSELAGKPILIGGSSDRGVVASCSYEARKFGIHSAMPMRLARQLCPEAILVRGDMDQYSKYSAMVTEVIEQNAPLVEKASIDEHYLDISGMDKYFGCWKWTQELRQTIMKETGLPISFGLSSNKTVSKIATGQAKPCGVLQVNHGNEKAFLAPLSIKKIPMVGEKTYQQLRNLGVHKIQTLQQLEAKTVKNVLGQNGVIIWRKANGIDDTPVVPFREQKSMSKEHTYEQDTIDMKLLKKTIVQMIDQLAYELRTEGRLCTCLTLKIRYANFETFTKQIKVPLTSSDTLLTQKALLLFEKLYTRRMSIRLIGVKLSELVSGSYQTDLFNDAITDLNLMQAMDKIRNRFGNWSVMRTAAL